MKREQLAAALGVALVIMCGFALAWTPWASAAGSIRLDGRARIVQSRSAPSLILSATSSDGTGYGLESTLEMSFLQSVPTRSQTGRLTALSGRERGEGGDRRSRGESGSDDPTRGVPDQVDPSQAGQSIGLSGSFTLSDPTGQIVAGQATGTVDSTGSGSLTLADQNGGGQMEANFQVSADGRLQVDLLGVAPGGQSSTATGGQPSTAIGGQSLVAAASTVDPRTGDPTFWHIARAAGLSAYLMLFLNVFLGLAVHTRYLEGLLARWRSFDLHQFTALLAGGFLALHALALLGDRYMGFTLAQLVVPFAAPYRPFWTAMGVIAFYLLAAIFGSSYLRRHIGHRVWRAIHYAAFVAFLLALAHGVFAGTDSGEPWAAALYGGTGAIIGLLVALRFKTPAGRPAVAARGAAVPAERAASQPAVSDGFPAARS